MYLLLLVYSYKSSGASLISTALWYYLGTKHLDFRRENNSTPGINRGNTVCAYAYSYGTYMYVHVYVHISIAT